MTQLPDLLRRAPKIFYVFSFLFAAASFGLGYWEIRGVYGPYSEPANSAVRIAVFRQLYQALLEALYIVGTGALIDIAIRIWDKMDRKEAAQ